MNLITSGVHGKRTSFFFRLFHRYYQQVNTIPRVTTQSDFQAVIKSQNIPHASYDIDGDGVVSQEDYLLAKVSVA